MNSLKNIFFIEKLIWNLKIAKIKHISHHPHQNIDGSFRVPL